MHETELKFQVPPERRTALARALTGRRAPAHVRLAAVYFDTVGRALAGAGLGLRLRLEGDRWVQTLKGAAVGGMTRAEHNVARGEGARAPAVEPALHADTPVGAALLACLRDAADAAVAAVPARARSGSGAGAAPAALLPRYRTEIDRLHRALAVRAPRGRVELAFDTGRIVAGDAAVEVSEFEIEALAGSPLAVIATARRWVPRFGLWLDSRSKAERGDLLARGEAMAPPRLATPVRLQRDMTASHAWQAVLRSCADQIIVNASQVASGEHTDEHVHQLRVGLRRLRSALRFFGDSSAKGDPLAAPAAALFKLLGGARDRAVAEAEFGAPLAAARRAAGLAGTVPWPAVGVAGAPPTSSLRASACQLFLLDLLAAMHAGHHDIAPAAGAPGAAVTGRPLDPPAEAALRGLLAKRLNRWHRQVTSGAARFAELDDAARHRLRKRAKRLRYAAEFSASLFGARRVRRYLKALRRLQDRLGAFTDVTMAMQVLAPAAGASADGSADASADAVAPPLFELGWLAAQREPLIAAAASELKAFARVERFWKRG